jgi:hypothetical protein
VAYAFDPPAFFADFLFRDTSAVKSTHRALPQHAQALIHPFHITPNRPLSSKSTAAGAAAVSRIDRRDRTTQHSERGGVTTQHPNLNKPQAATSPEIEGDTSKKKMLPRASTLLSQRSAAAVAALGSRGRAAPRRVLLPAVLAPTTRWVGGWDVARRPADQIN